MKRTVVISYAVQKEIKLSGKDEKDLQEKFDKRMKKHFDSDKCWPSIAYVLNEEGEVVDSKLKVR